MHITAVISHVFMESLLFCILDFVDNRLLDLYGVEFGELPEITSLLTPHMRAYCHSKMHQLIYYGYAGLHSHFIYHNLLAVTEVTKGLKRGLHIEAKNYRGYDDQTLQICERRRKCSAKLRYQNQVVHFN